MIIGPVLIAIGFKLIGVLSMLIPWTIFIIVALNKRKSLINNFYKIKNARAKVNLVEANINTIRELYHSDYNYVAYNASVMPVVLRLSKLREDFIRMTSIDECLEITFVDDTFRIFIGPDTF